MRIVPLCSALGAAVLLSLCAPLSARAADPAPAAAAPAPSDEELDAAKEHFGKGKELYDKGDKKGAVEEFKLAYKLSKNAILLYNVALVFDELGEKAKALHYYEKFVKEAPDNDRTKDNKKIAAGRVTVLTKELSSDDDLDGKPAEPVKPVVAPPPPPAEPAKKAAVTAFTHVTLDEAPPAKPIDIAAQIPEDSGWKLSLYYRIQGKDEFTPVPMKVRFQELVGRIPAEVVRGQSIQYYIEVKDAQGRLVAQSGSPASPNIVYLDAKAKSHFYFQEGDPVEQEATPEKPTAAKPGAVSEGLDDEDPLGEGKGVRGQLDSDIDLGGSAPVSSRPTGDERSSDGKINWPMWGTTGGAALLLGSSVVFYYSAKSYSDKLHDDTLRHCSPSPCQFDSYSQDLQSKGQTYELVANVTLVVGVATAGVAAYFWYRELTTKHHYPTSTAKPSDQARSERGTRFVAAPLLGNGVIGGAAVIEF